MIYAIDFECYYDKKVSITTLGIHHYLHHPDCSIYLVSVYSAEAGFSYVGKPENLDWYQFYGHTFVAHNARFDRACFERLRELGIVPADMQVSWECTSDMVSALSYGRSLKDAVESVFGVIVSKDTRADMCGKTWEDAVRLGIAQRLGEYCLKDSWYAYHLWNKLSPLWSEKERCLSAHTRDMADYGICIDRKLLDEGLEKLTEVMLDAADLIPWKDEAPLLSPKALRNACAQADIPAPSSLAEDSPECAEWEEKYGNQFSWVAAMRDYRKANTLYKKLTTLRNQLRADSTFAYGLKYFGAHTGRWSGDAGFNIQNMPRSSMFGVDLRKMIIPRPGYKYIISDLAQIENRIIAWLSGDNAMMDQLAFGYSMYEAHARATMGYTDPEPLKQKNPDLYRLAKARVLGLGYGAGAAVFVRIAKTLAGLDITPQQAQRVVSEFRAANRLITALWSKLEMALSASVGKDFIMPLPSGRKLYYHNVGRTPKGLSAIVQGKRINLFGGKLAENLASATARDVLGEILLNLEAAGYQVVMHIHDEVVVEVPAANVDNAALDIHRIMTTTPAWLEGLPLAAETFISDHYTK